MAQPRIAAGALFLDNHERILLVRAADKPMWDIPGGYVEPGESPLAACVREVLEELSISPSIGQHLVVDWAPAEQEGDKLLFVFDGGTLDAAQLGQLQPDGTEVVEYRFVDLPELDRYVPARLVRRLRTALTARHRGMPLYAEHGEERPRS
jgi:ADP-ribose pyrophosphatase YjhB (NUDIX family)